MSNNRTRRVQLAFVYAIIVLAAVLLLKGGVISATAAPLAPTALSASLLQGALARENLQHGPILASTDTTTNTIMLPLVQKHWPPIPYQPTLSAIANIDGDGSYTASWTELPSRLADTYILQEATDVTFSDGLQVACTTAQQFCVLSGRLAGTYYYRVQGQNAWGYSSYSNVEMVTVLLPATPTLNYIDNADGDANYIVSWSTAARATNYTLQEDTSSNFEHPTTVYQGTSASWAASNKTPETYYYRVLANGPTGQGSWSNIQSVTVPVPSPVVRVLSSNAFVPYSGSSSWYIIGEVRNDTGSNVDFVQISATLRDGSGNVVDSDYTYSMIDTLSPGMTSPFRVIFSDPPGWVSYDFQVTWDTTSRQPYALDILNSTSYFDSSDAYHVVGEIRNQYAEQRTFVKAFVTMYDAQGKVIGVDYTYTNPDTLNPGQTASFDTDVYFWKYKPDRGKVASHRLQVYDD
jgi:hypothetical protein